MPIADNLSSEESKLMADMQANEPQEREIIREEKTGISSEEETPEIELRPEIKALIEPNKTEVKEETQAEEPEVKEAEKQKRLVPLAELQEERRARKEAQDASRIAQERMDALLAKLAPPEVVKPPVDVDKDPMGALKETRAELEELRQFRLQQEQQAQQNQYVNSIKEIAKNQEAEYVKENPDYVESGNFLMQQRIGQLRALGYDDVAARRQMAAESLALAETIAKQGRNIPQAIHELAKSSGFKPASVTATTTNESDRLENIARGQKANMSLSNANGVQQKTGKLDGASIAKMSEAQFSQLLDKMTGDERKTILGM